MISSIPLTHEEQLVLACAAALVDAECHEPTIRELVPKVIWRGVEFLLERNKMAGLAYRVLRNVPEGLVPQQVSARLRQNYLATFQRNQEFARLVARLSAAFHAEGLRVVFLRGLVLAERVYGNPSLRWFADVDILVPRRDAPRTLRVLEDLGGVPRPGTLTEGYYWRNHFHVERLMGNGNGPTVELHWGLDHRYTLFTIDVARLVRRAVEVPLALGPVWTLHPVDDLLALCLHAVKHCPSVRYFPRSPLLARRILVDGWLPQLVDIAMALRRYHDVDWECLVSTAREWGVEEGVCGALTAVHLILGTCPPAHVVHSLAPSPRVRVGASLVRAFVDPAVTLQPLECRSPATRLLLRKWRFQDDAVFHPVRVLDLLDCFFPPRHALCRWYGRPHLRPYWWWWSRHAASTALRLTWGALDLLASRLASRLGLGAPRRRGNAGPHMAGREKLAAGGV